MTKSKNKISRYVGNFVLARTFGIIGHFFTAHKVFLRRNVSHLKLKSFRGAFIELEESRGEIWSWKIRGLDYKSVIQSLRCVVRQER